MAQPYITVIYGIAFPTQILISPLCHHGYLRVGWSLLLAFLTECYS